MLTIPAKTVYIDPDVYERDNCRARLERILPHVTCDDVRPLDDAARELVARIGSRRHGKDDFGDDAVLVFTTYRPERRGWYFHLRRAEDVYRKQGGYCQTALELNIVDGCVFRCAYCGFGRRVEFSLDLERWMQELNRIFNEYPGQRLYKYSNMTDLPPFEPELDVVAPMVRRFASEQARYLMLFTKSDNVDFLEELQHGGRTIISWSVSCDTASRLVDKRAATMDERIAAMARMQAAGYHVRARLSPVVPVRDWQAEYRELFERMFAVARPDIVTLELLGWMDVGDLLKMFDRDLLDEDLVAAAEGAADELTEVNWGPFTQAAHEEVYRFCIECVRELSPETPVAVCHGTTATWDALGELLGMRADNYICNCGPQSAPGGELYEAMSGIQRNNMK
jgi:hypothetical protein